MCKFYFRQWSDHTVIESAGTAQGVDVALPYGGGVGGMERVQTQIFMTESAGTAQGVDVALP